MVRKIPEGSLEVLARLGGWGFPSDVLQRVGALAVVWGLFESTLETTLWSLRGEIVTGFRPSTDKSQVGDWIKELGQHWPNMSSEGNEVLHMSSLAAFELMEYRHAIMHGAMIPSTGMPVFIRNPRWHGEERKRASHAACVDRNLLDMAIEAAWILFQSVATARVACTEPQKVPKWNELKAEVARASSMARELRYLTELMNHEKY